MPRVQAKVEYPDFQKVVADVKRFGPLTEQYAETVAAQQGWRRPTGDRLDYNTRRDRGTQYLHGLIFRGEATETDVARAVWRFHLDRAQAAEMAHVTPYRDYL